MKRLKYFIPIWGISYMIEHADSPNDVFFGVLAIWFQVALLLGVISLTINILT